MKKGCLAAVCLGVLLVTGCGGTPQGQEGLSTSSSSTETTRETAAQTERTIFTQQETPVLTTAASENTTVSLFPATTSPSLPPVSTWPMMTGDPDPVPMPTQAHSQKEKIEKAVEQLNAALDKTEALQQLHFSYLSERWYTDGTDRVYVKGETEYWQNRASGQESYMHDSHSIAPFLKDKESWYTVFIKSNDRYERRRSQLKPNFTVSKESGQFNLSEEKPLYTGLRFGDNGINPDATPRNGSIFALKRLSPEMVTAVEEKNGEIILKYQAVPLTYDADDQYGGRKAEHTASFSLSKDGYLLSLKVSYIAHCDYSDIFHMTVNKNVADIQEVITFTVHDPGRPVSIAKPDWAAVLD